VSKIEKMLKVMDGVNLYNKSVITEITHGIKDGVISVQSWKYARDIDQRFAEQTAREPNLLPYHHDENPKSEWTTYSGYIDYELKVDGFIHVTIHKGVNFGDDKIRFLDLVLEAPMTLIEEVFGKDIERRFFRHAEDTYNREQNQAYRRAIDGVANRLLSEVEV